MALVAGLGIHARSVGWPKEFKRAATVLRAVNTDNGDHRRPCLFSLRYRPVRCARQALSHQSRSKLRSLTCWGIVGY